MSIQIGAEGTFGPAAAAIGNGLLKNYNMKPDDVRFFTVHTEADEDHSSLAARDRRALSPLAALAGTNAAKQRSGAWNCSTISGPSTATINKLKTEKAATLKWKN